MNRIFDRPWKMIGVVIVVFVMLTIFLTNKSAPLPAYVSENDIPTNTDEAAQINIETKTYKNEQINFTMEIPIEWDEVIKGGNPMFVHTPTGTSVQIKVNDYDPSIHTFNEETLQQNLSAQGLVLVGYDVGESMYFYTYTQQKTNQTHVRYMEIVMFDKSNIVTITYTVNSDIHEKMENAITYSIDSIRWERPNPIPTGLTLAYSDFGKFVYAVPNGWVAGFVESGFFAQDEQTGATMAISAEESTINFKDITKESYIKYASSMYDGFVLSEYNADSRTIYALGSYAIDGVEVVMIQYMIATGEMEYSITFNCPVQFFSDLAPLFKDAINCLTIY